jgi:glycosyltransferase involved in cell wall biosynthesis
MMENKPPFFSIIVPTYNRPAQLKSCLQSLSQLDYPNDRYEVIVVDDGSEEPPDGVVSAFLEKININLFTQRNLGPASARNKGAAHAKGTFLAFTDDDCLPAPDWIKKIADRFKNTPDHLIGGLIVNALPDNPYSTASQLLIDYLYSYYNADHNRARFFTSNNIAVSSELFRAVGGFNTVFTRSAGEDRAFCYSWLHHGYKASYAPEAVIYHFNVQSFRAFWRQHFHYGRGAYSFHRARSKFEGAEINLEPPAFYLNLIYYPFIKLNKRQAFYISALLALSQGIHVTGYVREIIGQYGDR